MSRRLVPILVPILAAAGCSEEKETSAATSTSQTTSAAAVESTTTTSTTTTTTPGLSDESRLGFDGIGPIKIFMTVAQGQAAVGRPIIVSNDEVSEGCEFAKVEGGPDSLRFMVNRDKGSDPWLIVRVDVSKGPIATVSGLKVGATEDEVKAAYSGKDGTYTVEPHPYTAPEGHYLIYDVDGKGGRQLIFETDGKKVLTFRAGDEGAVQAIEGCA